MKIKTLKGVGPKKEAALRKMGIFDTEDLLYHFPRDYEDRRNRVKIKNLEPDIPAVITAKVVSVTNPPYLKNKKIPLKVLVQDDTGAVELVFFEYKYLRNKFKRGQRLDIYGKPVLNNLVYQMIHPDFGSVDTKGGILPVYPLVKGVSQVDMRNWQNQVRNMIRDIKEYLPEETINRQNLCSIHYALENIHFPETKQKLSESKYRLIFEELLLLQAGLMTLKNIHGIKEKGIEFSNAVDTEQFVSELPFKLTKAQRRVMWDINDDMESARAMNRLVQGDVGSGKTIIAAIAIYKAVMSEYQAVMMAPTELLARQHADEMQRLFESFDITIALLSSNVKGKTREDILSRLKSGEIDVLIGTHALIEPNVEFRDLGLVVTDEQHRFGVNQRINLSQKGRNPDILVMTATPIPRTLAFILYGDLDISIIDELPPGRQAVITKAENSSTRNAAYEFIAREVEDGRQAYVVAPLIEDSDVLEELRSATGLFEELQQKLEGCELALLHGDMKSSEKQDIMKRFYYGDIDVLVSTVVIEVGINVINATIMVIENAERFGLSQLHQLRGRVGRGKEQSYCILITDSDSEDATERAQIMVSTDDGFIIAEKDLELRGPGDLFGVRQHGLPPLQIADLVKNIKMLDTVKNEASTILEADRFLEFEKNRAFKRRINTLFSDAGKIGL